MATSDDGPQPTKSAISNPPLPANHLTRRRQRPNQQQHHHEKEETDKDCHFRQLWHLPLVRQVFLFLFLFWAIIYFGTTFRRLLDVTTTATTTATATTTKNSSALESAHFDDNNHPQPGSAIFYNVYIDPEKPDNGIRIVTEQTLQVVQQIESSSYYSSPGGSSSSKPGLYYNMIGYNYTTPFCPANLSCTMLGWYENAFEEVTLQSLHEYCVAHPHDVVYYIHNKGSYTQLEQNEQTRREQTEFVFSDEAMHRLEQVQHGTCTIVGTNWEAFPWWHLSGNFWLAKCSYVKKLLPPKEFQEARVQLVQRLLHPDHQQPVSPLYCLARFLNLENVTTTDEFSVEMRHVMGMDRFSNEHWISSHPDVVPCDNDNTVFNSTLTDFDNAAIVKSAFGQWNDQYRYEWYRWNGRLFEVYQLYQSFPPNGSLFYQYYQGTENPELPALCREGQGRDLDAYFQISE